MKIFVLKFDFATIISPPNTFMIKGKDPDPEPDPYLWLTDPDVNPEH